MKKNDFEKKEEEKIFSFLKRRKTMACHALAQPLAAAFLNAPPLADLQGSDSQHSQHTYTI